MQGLCCLSRIPLVRAEGPLPEVTRREQVAERQREWKVKAAAVGRESIECKSHG